MGIRPASASTLMDMLGWRIASLLACFAVLIAGLPSSGASAQHPVASIPGLLRRFSHPLSRSLGHRTLVNDFYLPSRGSMGAATPYAPEGSWSDEYPYVLSDAAVSGRLDARTRFLTKHLHASRSHAGRRPWSSVPANVLRKFSDVGLCEKEAILAVLVRRARDKLTIYTSKYLVALNCKHVQQFRSRIRRICSAKQLHQNHRVVTLDSVYRPANSL